MKEALNAVCNFGFRSLHFHTIEANIHPDNAASAALLESAGFVREGYFKESYYFNGKFSDAAIYSLISPVSHIPH